MPPSMKLSEEITPLDAVEAAYGELLAEGARRLRSGMPVLIECDKDMTVFVYKILRERLKKDNIGCIYLDGQERKEATQGGDSALQSRSMMDSIVSQLREAVRGLVLGKVVVLPHLDLLTVSQQDLTSQGREVVPLFHENPDLVWLGFNDPSYALPPVVAQLFPWKANLIGIPRDRISRLVTQNELAKFGVNYSPIDLYKYVSGLNPVRLRKIFSRIEGPDFPDTPRHALLQIRQATVAGQLEIPHVDLEKDIGGYADVKKHLNEEVLDILARRDLATDEASRQHLERLIPRGIIFWGPPGTGKTLFAKAFATSLGATVTIISGPELKSKWVGQSESNLRRVFHQARMSAPSVIVFDEIDSFAVKRGTYGGSGVEHSLVNQLLTEMDGFRREELVFVIGTTNFAESLDPALLRPGRFEYQLEIPYPDEEARRKILEIHDKTWRLALSPEALDRAVDRTRHGVPGAAPGTHFSGDHLQALCRSIARDRLRANRSDPTTPEDIEGALSAMNRLPRMTKSEQRIVAIHESGHALTTLLTPNSPPLRRISLQDDVVGTSGYVECFSRPNRHVVTLGEMLDRICVLMGGREAERLLLGDITLGATQDILMATQIARELVEVHGLGSVGLAPLNARGDHPDRQNHWGTALRDKLDQAINDILEKQRERSTSILKSNLKLLETLANLLLEKQSLDATELGHYFKAKGIALLDAKTKVDS